MRRRTHWRRRRARAGPFARISPDADGASGWSSRMSIPGSPNGYDGQQRADGGGGFPTLWGTPWDALHQHPHNPLWIRSLAALVVLTWPQGAKPPSRAHALDTLQGALDALDLDDRHRGVVVAHADTDSPHVHVLVSRVCPETGRGP